jgi:hypothetical protein
MDSGNARDSDNARDNCTNLIGRGKGKMPKQSRYALRQLMESIEADLDRLGLQAQVLRYFVHERPARRSAAAGTSYRPESTRRTDSRRTADDGTGG